MKTKKKAVTTIVALILSMGSMGSQLFAQQEGSLIAEKGGKFHIGSSVLVGTTLLKSGMYKVQHVREGNDHVLIFRVIRMNKYKNPMGNERLGEEVARVKCTTEPVSKKWRNPKLLVTRNASGQRVAEFVQIKGENVLHKL